MQKYSLRIPGINETNTTLAHPTALRVIPWFILLGGVFDFLIATLPTVIASFNRYPVSWIEPVGILLPVVMFLTISYFLASRIKYGDMVFVWWLRIASAIRIVSVVALLLQGYIFTSQYQSEFPGMDYFSPVFILRQLLTILISTYMLYVLFKYENEIRDGGDSFRKEAGYSASKERLAHRVGIVIIIVIPIVYTFGFSLWSLRVPTQGFVQESDIPTYQYTP